MQRTSLSRNFWIMRENKVSWIEVLIVVVLTTYCEMYSMRVNAWWQASGEEKDHMTSQHLSTLACPCTWQALNSLIPEAQTDTPKKYSLTTTYRTLSFTVWYTSKVHTVTNPYLFSVVVIVRFGLHLRLRCMRKAGMSCIFSHFPWWEIFGDCLSIFNNCFLPFWIVLGEWISFVGSWNH